MKSAAVAAVLLIVAAAQYAGAATEGAGAPQAKVVQGARTVPGVAAASVRHAKAEAYVSTFAAVTRSAPQPGTSAMVLAGLLGAAAIARRRARLR